MRNFVSAILALSFLSLSSHAFGGDAGAVKKDMRSTVVIAMVQEEWV